MGRASIETRDRIADAELPCCDGVRPRAIICPSSEAPNSWQSRPCIQGSMFHQLASTAMSLCADYTWEFARSGNPSTCTETLRRQLGSVMLRKRLATTFSAEARMRTCARQICKYHGGGDLWVQGDARNRRGFYITP